jgi:hypothetical protein
MKNGNTRAIKSSSESDQQAFKQFHFPGLFLASHAIPDAAYADDARYDPDRLADSGSGTGKAVHANFALSE